MLLSQIREQMSGPEISWYWGPFFPLFRGQKFFFLIFWKHHSVHTEKLHNTCSIKNSKKIFLTWKSEKNSFFRAKNLSVNTWRSGPDICSLICASSPLLASHVVYDLKAIPAWVKRLEKPLATTKRAIFMPP